MSAKRGRRHFLKTVGGVAVAAAGLSAAFASRASAKFRDDKTYVIRLRADATKVIGWTLYLNNGFGMVLKNDSKSDPSILWKLTYIDSSETAFTIGCADQAHASELMSWSPLHQQCYLTASYPKSEIVHFIAVPADQGYVKLARTNYPTWTDVLDASGNGPWPAETIIYNWSDNGGQNQQWSIEEA